MLQVITIAALCINIEQAGRILFSNPHSIVLNYGMAFSTFQDMPTLATVLSGVACVMIGAVFFVELDEWERFGYSLMLGGALSNFAEKVILGYVIDWIPLPFIPLVINIADIEVSLGALIAFVGFMT